MIFGHCVCSTSANIIYSITLGNKESKTRTADTQLDRQMVTVIIRILVAFIPSAQVLLVNQLTRL